MSGARVAIFAFVAHGFNVQDSIAFRGVDVSLPDHAGECCALFHIKRKQDKINMNICRKDIAKLMTNIQDTRFLFQLHRVKKKDVKLNVTKKAVTVM